jgi:hypothetical protein
MLAGSANMGRGWARGSPKIPKKWKLLKDWFKRLWYINHEPNVVMARINLADT